MLFAADRVRVDQHRLGGNATVLRNCSRCRPGPPCVQVAFDGAARGGVGALSCEPISRLSLLLQRRRTLADALRVDCPSATESSTMNDDGARDWVPARAASASELPSIMVQLSPSEGDEWSRGLLLPRYVLSNLPPPIDDAPLHLMAPLTGGGRAPVLPSLFVPGFPKSATTWLYACLVDAFSLWRSDCAVTLGSNTSSCTQRFLLTAMSASRRLRGELMLDSVKETFYYGGSRQNLYRRDLLTLHGPDAALPGEPQLWPWLLPLRKATRGLAAQSVLEGRLERVCTRASGPCKEVEVRGKGKGLRRRQESDTCVHPGCHRVTRHRPETSSAACSWEEDQVGVQMGRNTSHCVFSMLPWASERSSARFVVGDFTPNYLCDAQALARLRASSPRPDLLRFVVLMREPSARALSEWSMFALAWAWDPLERFEDSLIMRIANLRDCNRTLFRNVALLRSLPTHELAAYLSRCWNRGGSMMYATTSLYSVCVMHALRIFPRDQFLFLRYEDLMRMDTEAVLKLIARFSGLSVDANIIAAAKKRGLCQPRGTSRKGQSTFARLSPSEKVLFNASKARLRSPEVRRQLSSFFTPYNKLLSDLIHEEFRWA